MPPRREPSQPEPAALARSLAALCPGEGSHPTAIPGLFITRYSTVQVPRQALSSAVLCVTAQGSKSTLLRGERHIYAPGRYLLVPLGLPLVGQIEEASVSRPFLSCSLVLDFGEIHALLGDARSLRKSPSRTQTPFTIGCMDEPLLDAVHRLVRLLHTPEHIPVLAPLVRREIYYRLLLGEDNDLLFRMVGENGKAQRISAGLEWLRQNAARPIRMAELARELHMSPSAMHTWFRAVTAMSPLEYLQQLRLHAARQAMLTDALDAGAAARRVGYRSASQFTREYKRLFGAPPARDVERLRAAVTAGAQPGSKL